MQKPKKTQIEFSAEQIQLIKTQIAPKATDDELKLFLYQAQRTGLDPLARQIYCIHRKSGGVEKMTIQTSIDGFRVIAERTGDYGGQSAPLFEEFNGLPTKCTISVYRFKGDLRYEAAIAVAYFNEYVQLKDEYINGNKTGKKVPAEMWAKMPHTMLAKVAEALALRKAYPQDLSGLYTNDEMAQIENGEAEELKQLTEATAIPFTPNYTEQPKGQPVYTQQQAADTQQGPAQTPYNKKYTDLNALLAVVASAAKVEELTQLYFANQDYIDKNLSIKEAISARRDTINNQGKAAITDNQYKQLCERISKGDATALESAKGVFILKSAQMEELEHINKQRILLEEAIALKYTNTEDIANIITQCTTPDYVLRLHKNNAMIIDRDPDLTNKINGKLKTLKQVA